jgi:TRAP-type C4-dicarboxylate transport system permease small subunit
MMDGIAKVDAVPGTIWARRARAAVRGIDMVCSLLFVVVFLAFLYKIFMRYAQGDAVAWADEITVVLFIWIVFLANSFLVEDRRQICFDLVDRNLPDGGRRAIAIFRMLLLGGILLYSLPGALDYIQFLWRERTPVLRLRLDFIYSCFGIFLVATLVRMAHRIIVLLRPGWRDTL